MNNTLAKNAAAQAPAVHTTSIINHPPPHLLSQPQPPTLGAPHLHGHFQLSQPQTHLLAQSSQFAPSHAQVQSQHPQPPTQPVNILHGNDNNTNVAAATPATVKRAAQKPPSLLSGSSTANQASPFKTMELTPAPPRKKRNLAEKQIPEKLAAILPESALYTQLLELEAQVDATLARKKIDIQEAVGNPPCVRKTLRIYVYNTFLNQASLDSQKKVGEEPSWSLKITGRILEDGKDPVAARITEKSSPSYPKFSAFFKKIMIYLDQGIVT